MVPNINIEIDIYQYNISILCNNAQNKIKYLDICDIFFREVKICITKGPIIVIN